MPGRLQDKVALVTEAAGGLAAPRRWPWPERGAGGGRQPWQR